MKFHYTSEKNSLPPFLDLNPGVCSAIQQYRKSNLGIRGVKMMSQYLHKQYSTHTDLLYYVWVLFTNGPKSLALTMSPEGIVMMWMSMRKSQQSTTTEKFRLSGQGK
jgi:hypothetical protein